jgi:hypothetical protein
MRPPFILASGFNFVLFLKLLFQLTQEFEFGGGRHDISPK